MSPFFFLNSPLEHFENSIFTFSHLLKHDISVNNMFLYLLSLFFFLAFFILAVNKLVVSPYPSQFAVENLFFTILTIFKQQISSARILRYYPLIFNLFVYIFILNFSSLFIFGVSVTGHIMVTSYLSFTFFLAIVIIGFLNHGSDFFKLFVPQNVPNLLIDFLIVIEVFSFLIRPFSLSIRLFANMLAGHTLLGIFAQFGSYVIKNFFTFLVLPIFLLLIIFFLEIAVSVIQAYIFVSLVSIYLNDVIILH